MNRIADKNTKEIQLSSIAGRGGKWGLDSAQRVCSRASTFLSPISKILHAVLIVTFVVFPYPGNSDNPNSQANVKVEKTTLFAKGKYGYNNTRIPALIVTQKGTLLAFAEGRVAGDTGRIHLILRRSEDGGDTWSRPQIVWKDGENTCGNPCPVVDQKSGDIILLTTWNRGDDKESDIVKKTSKDTRRVYVCRSRDDGKTWSKPRDITSDAKRPEWGWYATGPGVGIQLKRGAHKGRLVIPCDNSHDDPDGNIRGGPYNYGSHVIYSDDGGETWTLGGTIQPGCNECQVVELADGRLMMNMRAYGELSKKRAVAFSDDGGETWSGPFSEPALVEPTCQASFLRYSTEEGGGENRLLFSNPASQKDRVNLTLRLSYDEGKTWPVAKVLHEGPAAYSCLTVLPGGDIGCLYEAGEKNRYDTITFARVPLEWLEEPKRTRFLLLDSRVVEKTSNAKLVIGKVKKDPRNPLFREDKPWEPRYDNLYANVLYDPEEELYKCWYSPFIICESSSNTPRDKRAELEYMGKHTGRKREMGICYAVSKDGILWEKPELGVVEFGGNRRNNLVVRGPHGAGVLKDLYERNPAKRYKMFFKDKDMSVAFSPDGIHWDDAIRCPEIDVPGDTHNHAFFAPDRGEYVGITRMKGGSPRVRQVGWTRSDDFLNWTKGVVVLQGLEDHLQLYAIPTFYYGGVYIGLPAIYNSKEDRTHTELAWSPDTIHWNRVNPGTPLIANGEEKGDYDWGTVYAAWSPVILKDEIRLYYGSCNAQHFDWRDGFFCLATLRPDGFAGYEAIESGKPSFVTTKPIECVRNELRLTADVEEGGHIIIIALNDRKEKIAISAVIDGTVTDERIIWSFNQDFSSFRNKKIQLTFRFTGAKIYSFRFAD